MSTETVDLHPAQSTAAAVAQGAIDAREEAIRIVQGKSSKEPAKGQPDVKATPSEPDAGESDASDDPAQPTEGDPKPETDRVSKRIAAAMRLEQRSARERAEIAGERAQLEQTRQSVSEQLKSIEAREAKFKLIESDPVRAFEELGIDLRDFLDRLSGEHNPVTLKFKELEKRLDAERAERERIEQESKRREQELQFHAAKEASTKAFISHIAENADQYPHLTDEFTPDEIAARGWEVAAQHADEYHRRFGEYPDDSVIAEYLEAQAKARAEQRNAWRARLKKSPQPSQGTTSASALKPRTLTNSTASQKASAPRALSDRDAREEAMKIIQMMHAKGA